MQFSFSSADIVEIPPPKNTWQVSTTASCYILSFIALQDRAQSCCDLWFWIDVITYGNVFPSFSALPQRWEQRLQEQKQRTARSKNQNAGRSGRSGASKPSNKNTNTLVSSPKKATKTRNGQKETKAKKV